MHIDLFKAFKIEVTTFVQFSTGWYAAMCISTDIKVSMIDVKAVLKDSLVRRPRLINQINQKMVRWGRRTNQIIT